MRERDRAGRRRAACSPTPISDGAFPTAASASTRARHATSSGSAATSCCSRTAARAAQPFLVLVCAPRPDRSRCASPGQLVGGRARRAPMRARALQTTPQRPALLAQMTDRSTCSAPAIARAAAIAPLAEILPWFAHDALIHYSRAARLEQYSGGGWGTRDVCQGPVELLLALGRAAPVRDLLLRVFAQPESRRRLAAVVHVLRARARHPSRRLARRHRVLAAARARAVPARVRRRALARRGAARSSIPRATRSAERASVLGARGARARADRAARDPGHAARGLRPRRLERLAAARRSRAAPSSLCSAWTVTLHHQTVDTLARRCAASAAAALADELEASLAAHPRRLPAPARRGRRRGGPRALRRGDGAGRDTGCTRAIARPASRYSLLPMIHAILADLFTPEQARRARRS